MELVGRITFCPVEIDEGQPNEHKQRQLSESLRLQETITSVLAETQRKASRDVGMFSSGKQISLQVCPDCRLFMWKLEESLWEAGSPL